MEEAKTDRRDSEEAKSTSSRRFDVDRLATAIGDDLEKGKAAAAVLLCQPFAPIIYHGDEIGMRGAKNTGYSGDAADIPMREPFKWNAVAGPPMSNYWILNGPAYAGRYKALGSLGSGEDIQLRGPGKLPAPLRRGRARRK